MPKSIRLRSRKSIGICVNRSWKSSFLPEVNGGEIQFTDVKRYDMIVKLWLQKNLRNIQNISLVKSAVQHKNHKLSMFQINKGA